MVDAAAVHSSQLFSGHLQVVSVTGTTQPLHLVALRGMRAGGNRVATLDGCRSVEQVASGAAAEEPAALGALREPAASGEGEPAPQGQEGADLPMAPGEAAAREGVNVPGPGAGKLFFFFQEAACHTLTAPFSRAQRQRAPLALSSSPTRASKQL